MEAVHWFLKASRQDVVGLVSWGLAGVPGRSQESRDGSDRGPARLREGQVTHLAQQGQTAPFPLFGVGGDSSQSALLGLRLRLGGVLSSA